MASNVEDHGVLKNPCGTWQYHQRLLARDPDYRKRFLGGQAFINQYVERNADGAFRLSPAVIPVVVHIVYNTAAQNLSDAAVQSQIDSLNRDYSKSNADVTSAPAPFAALAADAGVQFQLAIRDPNCQPTNGITRTQTTTTSFDIFGTDDVKSAATGGADPWPADDYLNIWVCPAQSGQGGRSTFPGAPASVDGVIVNYQVFGPGGAPYTLGRVTVHEVGHYFSLYHVFQGGCANGDLVADTPPQESANSGSPAFPHITCNNGPNGDMFVNYMDYTVDASKMLFTVGQVARIQAALTGPRASLLASSGLIPPPSPDVGQLWSADTPLDTGVEPDPSTAPMWQSEDIWVRNQQDGLTYQDHQNPVYRPSGSPPNYVYVRVRNRSCGHPDHGNLKVYWAKASTALSWPAPWDGSVTSPALMGGAIGTLATGTIPGRGSTVLEFPWSPPNPSDYTMFGGDKNHFCLLARIETTAAPPYGMTSPEASYLYENVKNNNKIVWKNVEVVTGNFELSGFVTVGNADEEPSELMLRVHAPALSERDAFGHVLLELPEELAGKVAEIKLDPKVATLEHNALRIRKFDKPIGPLKFDAHEYHTVGIRIVPDERAPAFGLFPVDITQHEIRGKKEVVIGGQRVAFKVLPVGHPTAPTLAGCWWHSHEEDEDNLQVFRPEGHEFPVSLGRWGFQLGDDHTATIFDIAAGEGIEEVEGSWWTPDGERFHVELADPSRDDVMLRVHAVEDDKIVLQRRAIGAGDHGS